MKNFSVFFTILLFLSCSRAEEFLGIDAPVVESSSPSDNQMMVSPNAEILIRFSKDMDKLITARSFSLFAGNIRINGYISWSDSKTLKFLPQKPMTDNTTYNYILTADAEDTDGNNLKDEYTCKFYIGDDIIAPEIVSIIPSHDSIGNDPNSNIVVTFSESVDPNSIVDGVSLSPFVKFVYSMDATGCILTIDPIYNFDYGVTYSVSLGTSIRDLAGNSLKEKKEYYFTVGNDFVAPEIVSVEQNGIVFDPDLLTSISRFDGIDVYFTEQITIPSINSAVSLSPAVPFSYSIAGNHLRLNFNSNLDCSTNYKLSLFSAGIFDLQKNKLNRDYYYMVKSNLSGSEYLSVSSMAFNGVPTVVGEVEQITFTTSSPITCSRFVVSFDRPVDVFSSDFSADTLVGGGTVIFSNVEWVGLSVVGGKAVSSQVEFDMIFSGLSPSATVVKFKISGGKAGLKDANSNYMEKDFEQFLSIM